MADETIGTGDTPDPSRIGAWRSGSGRQKLLVPIGRLADAGVGSRLRALRLQRKLDEATLAERVREACGQCPTSDDIRRIETSPASTIEDALLIAGITWALDVKPEDVFDVPDDLAESQ